MADAALWLYGIAFEELQRHIGVECRERAQVLACLWEHCYRLTELRCAVQYEALLAHSRQGFQGLADQRLYLKGQMRCASLECNCQWGCVSQCLKSWKVVMNVVE